MKKQFELKTSLPTGYVEGWLQYQLRVYPEIQWWREEERFYLLLEEEDEIARSFLIHINEFLKGEYECVETELRNQIPTEQTKKVLPLSQEKAKVTHVPYHLLYFQIPFLNEAIAPWYYANFINTVYIQDQYFDYTDDRGFYQDIFESSVLDKNGWIPYNSTEVFIPYIKQDFYIIALIDNYYNSASRHYTNNHDVHHILIHGFDVAEKQYDCVFFDPLKPITKVRVPFDEIHKGIRSARLYSTFLSYDKLISFVKPRELFRSFDRAYERILSELLDYLSGTGRNDAIFFLLSRPQIKDDYVYGIELSKVLQEGLQYRCLGKLDYRAFHLAADNKKLIFERLQYMMDTLSLSPALQQVLREYEKVVQAYEEIRMRYLKQSLTESNFKTFYPIPEDEKTVNALIAKIKETYVLEKRILTQAYPMLVTEILGEDGDLLLGKFRALTERKNPDAEKKPFYSLKKDPCAFVSADGARKLLKGTEELSFSGNGEYAEVAAEVFPEKMHQFSCAVRFKMDCYPTSVCSLLGKNDNENEIFNFRILLENTGCGHGVIHTQNNAWYNEGTLAFWREPLSIGQWHHVVFSYDGHRTMVYVDGKIHEGGWKEISGDIINTEIPLRLGGQEKGDAAFCGKIRDLHLFSAALNHRDALKLYHEKM